VAALLSTLAAPTVAMLVNFIFILHVAPSGTVVFLLFTTLVLLVVAAVPLSRSSLSVDERGISFGGRISVRWQDVREASVKNIVGVRYVVLTHITGRKSTILADLPGGREFRTCLLRFARDRRTVVAVILCSHLNGGWLWNGGTPQW
jgi:hypothetical protein